MAKILLEEEYDFEFNLLGISSHVHGYRICWAVNKMLGLDLAKLDEEILIRTNKIAEPTSFSVYYYLDENSEVEFELIANRHEQGYLVPELKTADYFLKISDYYPEEMDDVILELRKSSIINMAFEVDIDSLRSKQNLLFT
jgi:hypothetical protein